MPPTVFVAAPRIAGCSYEPIILRPVDLSEFRGLPTVQGLSTDLPPPGTGQPPPGTGQPPSGTGHQDYSDEEEYETDDSFFDEEYDVPVHEMQATPHDAPHV